MISDKEPLKTIDEMKSRLAELGVLTRGWHDYKPGRRLHFFDAEGIEGELVENSP